MVIIHGYMIKGQDAQEIETCLVLMRKKMNDRAKILYHEQLVEEIERIVDDIALNVYDRPVGQSILEIARNNLNDSIAWHTARGDETQYNYGASANILFTDDNTYIKLNCTSPDFRKAIGDIKGLVSFSLEDDIANGPDIEKEAVWKLLMKKYPQEVPMTGVTLMPGGEFKIEEKRLRFRSPNARAKIVARHNLTNRYLGIISRGQQIPNYRLMQYMDEALSMLTVEPGKSELKIMEADIKAKNLLPDITVRLVKTVYGGPVQPEIQHGKDLLEAKIQECPKENTCVDKASSEEE